MRSFVKKIASVLAAAFIISTFSMLVSASTLLDSGTVFGGHGSFSWEYYSDKTLKIYPSTNYLYIYESDFPSISLGYETTIYIDVSNLDPYNTWSFLSVYGYDCPCCYLVIGGSTLEDAQSISFNGFDALESVVFDDETNLNYVSISNCGLASVNIFDQAEINSLYISDSDYLENAKVPNYIKDLTIWDCDNLRSIDASEGLKYLFVNNAPLLTEINIPESLYSCYLENVGLTTITVPNTCEIFNIYSQDLEEAIIEPGRTRINASMFRECTSLREVNIPDGVTTIEYSAFAFCFDLPFVTLPDSVEKIYSGAFIGSGIHNMTIPEGVTSIEYATFRSCDNLEWINLPASITRIDESAFDSCENLTDVCFRGSRKQWDEITVYNGWDDKVSDKTLADIFGDADIWFDDLSIIKTQPVDFYGPYGSTAVFSIESYNEITDYQWQYYLDGGWSDFRIESATTSQLTLEVTEETVDLPVRCVLTDFSGFTETSEEACIVLIDEVNIVKQPEDLTCEPGEMATFSVEAEGEGLKYQWQVFKNGAWTNCSVKDGAKTPVLTLEAKESRDESRYKCIITDKYGYSYESAEASLFVRKALTILTQPENCSGAPGETATFTVVAEGSGLKYQWQVMKNGEWTNCSKNDGAKTATLTQEVKDSRNGFVYHCVITDKNGKTVTSSEVTLAVDKSLRIVEQPVGGEEEVSVPIGLKVLIPIEAEGDGLKYQWQVLKNGTWTNCSMNDGAKTNTLVIEMKESRDGSVYHCVVSDKYGNSETSDEIKLTMEKVITVFSDPADCYANLGDNAEFTIEAYGFDLKYQWQVLKKGVWTNCSINDGAKTDTLTLEAKESRDGCQYRCVITDKFENVHTTETVTLYIIDNALPAKPVQVPANSTVIESEDSVAAEEVVETVYVVDTVDTVETVDIVETVEEVVAETVTEVD